MLQPLSKKQRHYFETTVQKYGNILVDRSPYILIDHLRHFWNPLGHFPSICSDLIRDLIKSEYNGKLDSNVILSVLLEYGVVYLPKYFHDFTQLFQNNISVFSKVANLSYSNNPA